MCLESSGKPDAWKLARPVWGWGRGATPRPTPRADGTNPRFSPACRVREANRWGNGGLRTESSAGPENAVQTVLDRLTERTMKQGLPCFTHPTMRNAVLNI